MAITEYHAAGAHRAAIRGKGTDPVIAYQALDQDGIGVFRVSCVDHALGCVDFEPDSDGRSIISVHDGYAHGAGTRKLEGSDALVVLGQGELHEIGLPTPHAITTR